jgi:hypothetical protein
LSLFWRHVEVLERAAVAFELHTVACGVALDGGGGEVLRAAGGSDAGVSFNKLG